jgi:1-deoxy-D-xylulose-5-phosphate synthase
MEALNNLATTTNRLIVILNDNDFSIDRNVGALSLYLNRILCSGIYAALKRTVKKMLCHGNFAKAIVRYVRSIKRALKGLILPPTSYFEYYGLRYFGPFDGHSCVQLEEILEFCRDLNTPVLVHVKTTKGKGHGDAIRFPEKFHGLDPSKDVDSGHPRPTTHGEILGNELAKLCRRDGRIVAITAAMGHGTGLIRLKEEFPGQYVDVGIAESHGVTFAAALAKGGMKPICAIYSTFLQRSFDQILHDVCLQNLPVIFCLDRAGVSANDGATHHGLFDLSYLRSIPNAVILQPRNAQAFVDAIHSAMDWNRPTFIRYPKCCGTAVDIHTLEFSGPLPFGRGKILADGKGVCLLAIGDMVDLAWEVRHNLREADIDLAIAEALFVKPLDGELLLALAERYETIVTLEDNVLAGGFGSAILEFYGDRGISVKVLRFGWPDRFIGHGDSRRSLMDSNGLSAAAIAGKILSCRR